MGPRTASLPRAERVSRGRGPASLPGRSASLGVEDRFPRGPGPRRFPGRSASLGAEDRVAPCAGLWCSPRRVPVLPAEQPASPRGGPPRSPPRTLVLRAEDSVAPGGARPAALERTGCHSAQRLRDPRRRRYATNSAATFSDPRSDFARFVSTSHPAFVTQSVCSNCADSEPSTVRTVHLSFGSTFTSKRPRFTIGSIVNVMPALRRSPCPRRP